MTGRQFFLFALMWAVICLVATTPIGALLGFFLGFIWTFLAMLLTSAGAKMVFGIVMSLLLLVGLVAGIAGILRATRRDSHGAFAWWSTSVAFIGINTTLWLSMVATSRSIWGL